MQAAVRSWPEVGGRLLKGRVLDYDRSLPNVNRNGLSIVHDQALMQSLTWLLRTRNASASHKSLLSSRALLRIIIPSSVLLSYIPGRLTLCTRTAISLTGACTSPCESHSPNWQHHVGTTARKQCNCRPAWARVPPVLCTEWGLPCSGRRNGKIIPMLQQKSEFPSNRARLAWTGVSCHYDGRSLRAESTVMSRALRWFDNSSLRER